MIRVAMVEDDADLLDETCFNLGHQGFSVTGCGSGAELDRALGRASFDVVVLDVGLPGEDGYAIARRLRRDHPACGIVMLTARAGLDDRIQGLEEGADVYLAKPADFRELGLVIRALARRLAPVGTAAGGALVLVEAEQRLLLCDGGEVALTRSETILLARLARAPGQQASREQLAAAFGMEYAEYDPRRLEAVVSRLRRKLANAGLDGEVLRAVRHAGYRLALPLSGRG